MIPISTENDITISQIQILFLLELTLLIINIGFAHGGSQGYVTVENDF